MVRSDAVVGLGCVLLAAAVSCPGDIRVVDHCTTGTLQVCVCPDRTPSSAECQDDGSYGPCDCPADFGPAADVDSEVFDQVSDSDADVPAEDIENDTPVDLDENVDDTTDVLVDQPDESVEQPDRTVDSDPIEPDGRTDRPFEPPVADSETYTVACGNSFELTGTFSAPRPATQLVIRLKPYSLPANVGPLEGIQTFDDPMAGPQSFAIDIEVPDWMPGSEWRTDSFEMGEVGGTIQGSGGVLDIATITIRWVDPDLDQPAEPTLTDWGPRAPTAAGCTDRLWAEYEVFDERSGVAYAMVTLGGESVSLEGSFAPARLEGELRRVGVDLHYNLETGEYQATEVMLFDAAGNSSSFTSPELLFDVLVECAEFDVVPPALISLGAPVPSRVRPGVLFTVTGEAADTDGDLEHVQIDYGPAGGGGLGIICDVSAGGRFTCTSSVFAGADAGYWSLDSIQLRDSHGNEAFLSEGDDGFPENAAELGLEVLP